MASTTPVTDVMTKRRRHAVARDLSLPEAADVLAEKGIGAVPVVDGDGKLVGLLRDEDLLISEARLHLPTTIAILPGIDFTLPGSDQALRRGAEEGRVVDRRRRDGAASSSQVGPDATASRTSRR